MHAHFVASSATAWPESNLVTNRPLSIAEAINVLGCSEKTVRRMLKDGMLHEHSRDPRGRILITPESIAAAAEQLAERRHADEHAATPQPIVLASQTASLDRTIERLTSMLDERDRIIREQTDELATLRAERKYLPAPGRVQELEQEVTRLSAQLAERDRPVIDQPAHPTRKGWIARLFSRDQDTDR